MNETHQQLQKYMQADGYYDLGAIAKDETASDDDPLGLNATGMLFAGGGDISESNISDSPLMVAARAHNDELRRNANVVHENRIEQVLSAETLDIQEARALDLTEMDMFWHERTGLGDDYSNHTPIRLKKEYRYRRNVLLGKSDVVVGGSAPLASIVEIYGKEMPADLEIRWFVKWSRKTVIVRRVTYMSAGAATVEMPDGTTTTVNPSEVFEIVAR